MINTRENDLRLMHNTALIFVIFAVLLLLIVLVALNTNAKESSIDPQDVNANSFFGIVKPFLFGRLSTESLYGVWALSSIISATSVTFIVSSMRMRTDTRVFWIALALVIPVVGIFFFKNVREPISRRHNSQ